MFHTAVEEQSSYICGVSYNHFDENLESFSKPIVFANLAIVIRRGLDFAFRPIAESASHHFKFCVVRFFLQAVVVVFGRVAGSAMECQPKVTDP